MGDYVDLDGVAPMEFLHHESGLIFKWRQGSRNIEIGRLAEYLDGEAVLFDLNINLYDGATGKVEQLNGYEGFKARCLEWLVDSELIEPES